MPATPLIETSLVEVFSSIQGEGLLLGARQVFVRFSGCNLDCNYCDTNFSPGAICRIEKLPGSGTFDNHYNPISLLRLTKLIEGWQEQSNNVHHSVSLTGGEPLLHAETLKQWLPILQPVLPIFLETNGTLADELRKILPWLGFVSMDIKAESVSGQKTPWEDHAAFLECAGNKLYQVKIVVDKTTPAAEVEQAAQLVADCCQAIPLIIQPRTIKRRPDLNGAALLELQQVAAQFYGNVRVVPQVHPWLDMC